MINYENEGKFKQDSIKKDLKVTFSLPSGDTLVLTNENIYSESMSITESLCTESELRFGSCDSSEIEFTVAMQYALQTSAPSDWSTNYTNYYKIQDGEYVHVSGTTAPTWANNTYYTYVESFVGLDICVEVILDNDTSRSFIFGYYKVTEDKHTADRTKRQIKAYDALYEVLNADVASWWENLFPTPTTTKTIKQIRDSLFAYLNTEFGITQETTILPNDSVTVQKPFTTNTLSGKDVLHAICEINGVFGHMSRLNVFKYIALEPIEEGLYPADDLYPSNDLYPLTSSLAEIFGGEGLTYIDCQYEDYETATIDCVQIAKEDNDIGGAYPTGTSFNNGYKIVNNFLAFGQTTTVLNTMAQNIYNKVHQITYMPSKVTAIGNPCIEVGDGIRCMTRDKTVTTYVLQRRISGIQSLKDTYESQGEEYYTDNVNNIQKSFLQLQNRTNVLTRDVEETKSTVTEQGLTIDGMQTSISTVSQKADGLESTVSSQGQTISNLTTTVTNNVSRLDQRADSISASVSAETQARTNADSAKLDKLHTSETFGWDLNATRFTLKSNNEEVFVCNSSGITINGNGKFTGTIQATRGYIGVLDVSSDGTVSAPSITITRDGVNMGNILLVRRNTSSNPFEVTCNGDFACGNIHVEYDMDVRTVSASNTISASRIESPILRTPDGKVQLTSSSIGFFGRNSSQITVRQLSTSSSTAEIISKIREIISALHAYGLTGI